MLIVGLQCGHDASVAVVADGQILLHLERCGFRRKPAGYSDVKPATVPI